MRPGQQMADALFLCPFPHLSVLFLGDIAFWYPVRYTEDGGILTSLPFVSVPLAFVLERRRV